MILSSLAGYKPKEVKVPVPEIKKGGEILLRELLGSRASALWSLPTEKQTGINILIGSMIDKDGNQIHTFEEADQLIELVPASVLSRLITAAMEVNGFAAMKSAEDIHTFKKS